MAGNKLVGLLASQSYKTNWTNELGNFNAVEHNENIINAGNGVLVSAGCIILLFAIWPYKIIIQNPLGWTQADDQTNHLAAFFQMSSKNSQ